MTRLPGYGLLFVVCLLVSARGAEADPALADPKAPNLAFVLLNQAKMPRGEGIARAFASFAPKQQSLRPHAPKAGDRTGMGVLEFDMVPRGTAFVMLMPIAVPNREAEAAVEFSMSGIGTKWKLPAHKAHLIVTVRDAGDVRTVAELSRFTSLLAAIVQTANAVGIYWGGAGATHNPKFFVET